MAAEQERAYAFANAEAAQRERLRTLEALNDSGTKHQLNARGVAGGWRCLEVGAGGGSIAAWLCDRVAPDGAVLATDLDTTILGELSHPNLDVRAHDVLVDDLPAAEFDLVHMRLVLAWLPEPRTALRRLVAALRPGGWLVAEELDFASAVPDPAMGAEACARFTRLVEAHNAVLAEHHGFDFTYGRRLAGDLAGAGLTEGGCEGRASMWRGGEAGGLIWRLTIAQLRETMIADRRMRAADLDAAMTLCGEPRFSSLSPVMVAAWARRPPTRT
jgi:2-polyprenyl-3-methyl-5-hydroxy-6-metoxy-1,4-benzoquinol methylase